MKGFVIAGTGSGSGKTTASLGIMAWLAKMGYRVAPFKVGPDFIDPGHHTALTGTPSRNLDSWMLTQEVNQNIFARGCKDKDVAVVEGVMGLFDGYSGVSEAGSTAQMAKWLGLPVLLLVDARSMARSAAAIVKGFEEFDPDIKFAGVIFSKTGSDRHYEYLKEAVEDKCRMKCLGHLPRNENLVMPERHLGLVTSDEHLVSSTMVNTLVSMINDHTDLKKMVTTLPEIKTEIETKLPDFDKGNTTPAFSPALCEKKENKIRIAVARDKAFCFYYPENLEFLESAGAEPVFFSPMKDKYLPGNIHGIYLGGGYPELFAETLSKNIAMKQQIKEKSDQGMPVYGECGGFMYLCSHIIGMDGATQYPMTGCFPFTAVMSKKMRSLGYREILLEQDCLVGKKGDILRGHEFHYSSLEDDTLGYDGMQRIYKASARAGRNVSLEGYCRSNTLGSYMHIHFGSHPGAARTFVISCHNFRKTGKDTAQ
ncbi:cobyrinic acid a,c-diamide synthase [Desulfocicer vacuolatum DSM 3385]|uniref:Cobyrinate a,c-diamide synthase n=1 Tax=Desulfocicer vacuolatum DSM 3385 TaxID=1121400 RepID=A0A1W2CBE8_9BACT|nr:cobyrinate a,c-diamide synthase [Desulfocicer vacuolatum]SMC81978.1 cobyrinic acid a,c-diamide synthase [Desulfocicer vacuolatum DSM 3385]